jgi:anaerobic magnesium-protoporphyrin IX monomethyl ester cyclase
MPDDIGISVSYPLPGTTFYDRVRADLAARGNWVNSSDLAMLYRGPYSTGVYRRLHGVVHREFRLLRAAGTTAPWPHLRRALRRPWSRRALGRLRDAVTLPVDRLLLDTRARLDGGARRPPPGGRSIRVIPPDTGDPAA